MLPYEYGRRLFDATPYDYGGRLFDAVSLISIYQISFQAKTLFKSYPLSKISIIFIIFKIELLKKQAIAF
ncbi:hypothetical protein HMPREF1427_00482 [Helicobacter pylori GAM83Bi]|nr:hypothetical protein HMPREF1427_00482 [Helicobacter pylori GAM83Bi]EMH41115.1 hypothetical protein HMPREF1428_00085 [Helicobacter pylori GAM83T]